MSQNADATTYDLFVSYNSRDRTAVSNIAESLKRRGLSVFFDRWELKPGRSWTEALEQHLLHCRSAMIVIGPYGFGSWQHREKYLALDRQTRDRDFIVLPVLLPGADPPLGFLFENTWIDLQNNDDVALNRMLEALASDAHVNSEKGSEQPGVSSICPYRGLEVFREEDSAFFFGRDENTRQLHDRLVHKNFLALVGASGSGKSSIVRAGLLPLLRKRNSQLVWDILTITPGHDPLSALVRALDPPATDEIIANRAKLNTSVELLRTARVGLAQAVSDYLERQPGTDRLLIVVDQFEELATIADNKDDCNVFIELLLEATKPDSRLSIVLTLRSDFYEEIVSRRHLNDRLQDAVIHVGPLSSQSDSSHISELETVIRRPAETAGLQFEDGLVERIIMDVGNEPGNLPLLEYLLTELWRQRVGRILTHTAFDSLGGVQGAIAVNAELAFEKLSSRQQCDARRLFLSLVRPGDEQKHTRLPAPYPEHQGEAEVVQSFAGPGVRLLVADEDHLQGRRVQVGHEALIRGWSRLRGWIADNQETLRVRHRILERMRRWAREKCPDDLLLPQGLELEEGRQLLKSEDIVSMTEVREYIERSITADLARQAREEQRLKQKYRFIAAALCISVLLLGVAGWQWQLADNARDQVQIELVRADQQRDHAIAQRYAGIAQKIRDENPGQNSLAAMIALESQALGNTPEAGGLLRDILSQTPTQAKPVKHAWPYSELSFSGDGKVMLSAYRDGWREPSVTDPAAWSSIQHLQAGQLTLTSEHRYEGLATPLISPDDRWWVSAGNTRRLTISQLESNNTIVDITTSESTFPVFSPQSDTLYVAYQSGVIQIRHAPNWDVVGTLEFPVDGVRHNDLQLSITADGNNLLVVSKTHRAHIVPVDGSASIELDFDFDKFLPYFSINHVVSGLLSPVSNIALTQQRQGDNVLWDINTGSRILEFTDTGRSSTAAFSSDGIMLATADSEGHIVVRRVSDGEILQRLHHGKNWITGQHWINKLTFAKNNNIIVSAASDGDVVAWNTENGNEDFRYSAESSVNELVFNARNNTLIMGLQSGELVSIDANNGQVHARQLLGQEVMSMVSDSTGRTIASLSDSLCQYCWHKLRFVDRTTDEPMSSISYNGALRSLILSDDGSLFAAMDPFRQRVIIWETDNGEILQSFSSTSHPQRFSLDQKALIMHRHNDALQIVDIDTGGILHELGEPGGIKHVMAKTHHDVAVTRGFDDSLKSFDLATGAQLWERPANDDQRLHTMKADVKHFLVYTESSQTLELQDGVNDTSIIKLQGVSPDKALLGHDASRLLTVEYGNSHESALGSAIDISLWNTTESQKRILHRSSLARSVDIHPISNSLFGLSFYSVEKNELKANLEILDWSNGDVVWSINATHFREQDVLLINPERNQILVSINSSLQMRDLKTGHLLWKLDDTPVDSASNIINSNRIAVSERQTPSGRYAIRILDNATGTERFRLNTAGTVHSLAVTADGLYVVAGMESHPEKEEAAWKGLQVWRTSDGKFTNTLKLENTPTAIIAAKQPEIIAVTDSMGNLYSVNVISGKLGNKIIHGYSASSVALSSDTMHATTLAGTSIRMWDLETGTQLAQHASSGRVSAITMSSDGKQVAYLNEPQQNEVSGSTHKNAVIWTPGETEAQAEAQAVTLPVGNIGHIKLDKTGRYLALSEWTGLQENSVQVIDTLSLRTALSVRARRLGSIVKTDFSSDGRFLIITERAAYAKNSVSHQQYSLRVFTLADGSEITNLDINPRVLAIPDSSDSAFQDEQGRWLQFSPDSTTLDIPLLGTTADLLITTPDSSRVLTTAYQGASLVLDTHSNKSIVLSTADDASNILFADMDDRGEYIVLSKRSRDWHKDSTGTIVILGAKNGAELARLKVPLAMRAVKFANQGRAVIMSELRGSIQTDPDSLLMHWNWHTDELKELVSDNPVRIISTGRESDHFATLEGNRHPDYDLRQSVGTTQIRIWDEKNGDELFKIPRSADAHNLTLSPNGKLLATGDLNTLLLIQVDNGEEIAHFGATGSDSTESDVVQLASINSRMSNDKILVFSADNSKLVIAESNGAAVFDISTGTLQRLTAGESISSIALSSDNTHLAMAGDQLTTVWNLHSGKQLIKTKIAGVRSLAFGGTNGQILLGVQKENIVRILWQADELQTLACNAFAMGNWRQWRSHVISARVAAHPCTAEQPSY